MPFVALPSSVTTATIREICAALRDAGLLLAPGRACAGSASVAGSTMERLRVRMADDGLSWALFQL